MRILLAATPAAGHVTPLLGIAKMLVDQEHDVMFLTGTTFRQRVEATGAAHARLPAWIDYDFSDIDAVFPERASLRGLDRLRFDFERIFIGPLVAQHQTLTTLIEAFRADAVIVDHLFLGALPTMLQPRSDRPFMAACGLTFLPLPRADGMPHGLGIPFLESMAERRRRAQERPTDGGAVMGLIQASYEGAMRRAGASPKGDPMSAAALFADAYWQAGVPELEYPLDRMPANLAFIGRWPTAPTSVPTPAWFDGFDDGRLVVLVSQGTVANADLEQLVLPTMRSLADYEDIIVIGTAGGRHAVLEQDLPDNARLADYLPFDRVFPRVHAVVTNGGFGTVTQALAEGIPLVVAGDSEDKPEIAARVQYSGAGIDLETARPSEAQIAEAVNRTLDDPKIRSRAMALKASFDRHDAAQIIADALAQIGCLV
jgi:UDP:flavonoid glycosyltransferase YjiC (YdhE family)